MSAEWLAEQSGGLPRWTTDEGGERVSTPVILFLVWVFLVITTPVNPLINQNPYLTVPWFIVVQLYGLWVATRIAARRKGA